MLNRHCTYKNVYMYHNDVPIDTVYEMYICLLLIALESLHDVYIYLLQKGKAIPSKA